MHRHIWLNVRGWYDAMCFLGSVVCNSQHEPFVICLLYIVRGHPCMWALCFGEDIGGKSNVRRSASTSESMRINQCVHIVFMSCIKLATIWHKKAWNRPVVYSTSRGSCIAYYSRTDNVRAHADMKISTVRDLYNTFDYIPKGYNLCLQGLHGDWYNHTRDIYRWPYSRQQLWICKIRLVSNTASDKRLLYVLTLFPPIARLLPRKLFGLLSFQLGVGCLFVGIEKYSNRHTD